MASDRLQEDTLAGESGRRFYLGREPATLAVLSVLAVVVFLAVAGLSRVYHAQQESLGNRWFTRGLVDLKAQRFDRAVSEFRTALIYSRDNYAYQLNLAEALMGMKRTSEAYAYFINLWEREPENGLVNLELARIAAQKGQTDQAMRYYHNAIYATWPGDQEVERRNARLELIEFLLGINAKTQAQSELIALVANLDGDPALHARAGDLFLRAQDYEHALAEYRLSLKIERHNPAALAGAGWAAFELGRYPLAQRYLQGAVSANPSDTQSAARLKLTELVLEMDPFQRQISAAERDRIVIKSFAAAGERLKACPAVENLKEGTPSTGGQQSLGEKWETMKPRVTLQGLRRDPDLVERAMEVVFGIERQTSVACGSPSETDKALLLIAKLHEGN
ncbi:MAG: tetratricopeptide repeat protein [Terriglobales bacterium]